MSPSQLDLAANSAQKMLGICMAILPRDFAYFLGSSQAGGVGGEAAWGGQKLLGLVEIIPTGLPEPFRPRTLKKKTIMIK